MARSGLIAVIIVSTRHCRDRRSIIYISILISRVEISPESTWSMPRKHSNILWQRWFCNGACPITANTGTRIVCCSCRLSYCRFEFITVKLWSIHARVRLRFLFSSISLICRRNFILILFHFWIYNWGYWKPNGRKGILEQLKKLKKINLQL